MCIPTIIRRLSFLGVQGTSQVGVPEESREYMEVIVGYCRNMGAFCGPS